MDIKPVHEAVGVIGLLDLSLISLLLIPLACIFSSMLLAISIYARSFKEAQNYMAAIIAFSIHWFGKEEVLFR
jgi:sodium transport system permease protein